MTLKKKQNSGVLLLLWIKKQVGVGTIFNKVWKLLHLKTVKSHFSITVGPYVYKIGDYIPKF